MTDSPERAVAEAESWLASAKDKLAVAETEDAAANVCCALAIHAIIRANDAIALKFLRVKATRHDDAPTMFSKLLEQGKIKSENRHFLRLLQKAMMDKSGADYGKRVFSYETARQYVEDAGGFVATVRALIG
ncbi:hypothetical protein H0O00_03015 [Candidatus Micrarchaeota archaeon]|nr:hypothetical protein [Candidatus Micrarchaeota archaeon]